MSTRELALCAVLLLLLAALAYATHVEHGGYVTDDWAYKAVWEQAHDQGRSGIQALGEQPNLDHRPLEVLYQAAVQAAIGGHVQAELALTAVMAVILSLALYVLIRELGFEPLHAGLISALLLLTPIASSTRLWIATGYYSLAIAAYLAGVAVSLRAFAAPRPRSLWLHAVSLTLYVASVALNEITLVAIIVTVGVYILRAPMPIALARWACDLGVVGVFALLVTFSSQSETSDDWVHHAGALARQGAHVFGADVLPTGLPAWLVLGLTAGIAATAVGQLVREPNPPGTAPHELKRWLMLAVGGAVLAIAGYLVFVPGADFYRPLAEGPLDRTNALAAVGLVVLAYSTVVLAVLLVGRRGPSWLAWAVPSMAAIALGASYLAALRDREAAYASSASQQREVLAGIRKEVPRPPKGSVLFGFGIPTVTSYSVPVFVASFDLSSALQLQWNQPSLAAFPNSSSQQFKCVKPGLAATGPPIPGFVVAAYGKAILYDHRAGRSTTVTDRDRCTKMVRRFRTTSPGALPPHSPVGPGA